MKSTCGLIFLCLYPEPPHPIVLKQTSESPSPKCNLVMNVLYAPSYSLPNSNLFQTSRYNFQHRNPTKIHNSQKTFQMFLSYQITQAFFTISCVSWRKKRLCGHQERIQYSEPFTTWKLDGNLCQCSISKVLFFKKTALRILNITPEFLDVNLVSLQLYQI